MDQNERYNFDAPNQVVNLAALHDAPVDDGWFESLAGGHMETPLRPEERTPSEDDTGTGGDDPASSVPASNIVTSWGAASNPGAASKQPRRVSKRKVEAGGPPEKKLRKSPDAPPPQKSSRILRSRSLRATRSASRLQTTSSEPSSKELHQEGALSSEELELQKMRTLHQEGALSSEELELQRMRTLQQEVALHRKKNEAGYRAALAGDPLPRRRIHSVTVPKQFHFMTDTRLKGSAPADPPKEVNFMAQLRKPLSPAKAQRSATVPKPFNLSKGRRRKGEEPTEYVPMAQQVQMFHKKTPERFHQPSRQTQDRGPSPVKPAQRPSVKRPTVPADVHLQVERRLQERQSKRPPVEEEEEEPPQPFKSHPVPKKILEGVVGVPEKKTAAVTVPESPAFALKKRVRPEPAPVEVKPPSPIRAPPVPHFCLPFQPKLPEHHSVEVCPFSFDKREQEKRALKEKKLEQLRNSNVPEFKAQLLPDFSAVVLPEKRKLEPTKPEPFHLQVDARGRGKRSRWEQMVQEEKRQQEEARHFKAGPNVVIHKEPFKPQKEELADASSCSAPVFELSTERRARERQEFDRLLSQKEALRDLMNERQRQEEEEREKEEIARLRQEQVHKAQPVRHFRGLRVKKSEATLTVPQSPNFSDRFRM